MKTDNRKIVQKSEPKELTRPKAEDSQKNKTKKPN
jgi:hypothetical protein